MWISRKKYESLIKRIETMESERITFSFDPLPGPEGMEYYLCKKEYGLYKTELVEIIRMIMDACDLKYSPEYKSAGMVKRTTKK